MPPPPKRIRCTMGLLKKLKKAVKKIAPIAAGVIPGVGGAVAGLIADKAAGKKVRNPDYAPPVGAVDAGVLPPVDVPWFKRPMTFIIAGAVLSVLVVVFFVLKKR